MYNLGFPRSTHFIIPIIIIDDFILHLAIILYTNSSHIIIHNFVKTGVLTKLCATLDTCVQIVCYCIWSLLVVMYVHSYMHCTLLIVNLH